MEQIETQWLNKMMHGQAPARGLAHFQHACLNSKCQHTQLVTASPLCLHCLFIGDLIQVWALNDSNVFMPPKYTV